MANKGWIALDIDGTITHEIDSIPPVVLSYLRELSEKGWNLVFLSGRTLSFAEQIFKHFDFPFVIAVQNGADVVEMPTGKLLFRAYLKGNVIPAIEKTLDGQREDFLIYSGCEKGDFCYYRPNRFSSTYHSYIEKMKLLCSEPWKAVKTFTFDENAFFPLIKCFGSYEEMSKINALLSKVSDTKTTLIRDSVLKELYLNLVTDPDATKGQALTRIISIKGGRTGPVIAAGDDLNDISLFDAADFKIAMAASPPELLAKADLIAPATRASGIVDALSEAIENYD